MIYNENVIKFQFEITLIICFENLCEMKKMLISNLGFVENNICALMSNFYDW